MQQRRTYPLAQSLMIMITNMIPLYNVWYRGWNSFRLILLFIAEGAIVVLMDSLKSFFIPKDMQKGVLVFEFVFLFFFGFFAVLMFGRDPNSRDLVETIRSSFQAVRVIQFSPVAGILLMRFSRTMQELMASGALGCRSRKPLFFSGGGWMFQLFILVLIAPFIADKSPNPMAGLVAIIALKTLGELFMLWSQRIVK
ncbi:MAG: DUF6498-containing protein [Nitrospiraceae bacterium]|nr:DUF6498-containing protein [Nitrospiraceae bacterium]